MSPEPGGYGLYGCALADHLVHYQSLRVIRRCAELEAVDMEKDRTRREGDPLVAIDEGMVRR